MQGQGAAIRIFAILVLLAVTASFWFAQIDWSARPAVKLADAPQADFSATRAESVLAHILGPERPHPVSTPENAAVRGRILNELALLGMPATVYHAFGCNAARSFGFIACASVNDILAEVTPGSGKAVVMMAHYDSVPAGPGASDDESGVATVLETARAMKARGLVGKHPVLALITDGEEADLLGAAAFLHDSALRARVGAVVNVEARGNQGPSLLFQTSPGDGPLIDLYARSVPDFATSSLYAEIYRLLPNDTDLTLFIRDGFPSFNFAFSGNVAHYHTALDTRAHLDPVTLQQHGDNLLGVASALAQTDYPSLKGSNDIYVDVLGHVLPRLPATWALPLSILAFAVLLLAAFLGRGAHMGTRRRLAAFAATPALVVVAGLLGWLLHTVAALVSEMSDPSYAYPTTFRLSLALGVAASMLPVARLAPPRAMAASAWLWIGALAIVTSIFVTGFSPYFLFPALVAAVLLPLAAATSGGWEGDLGQILLFVCALPVLLLWVGFGASGESVMGLKLHPLFTVPIAFGMTALLPLFARQSLPRPVFVATTGLLLVASLAGAVIAGVQPAFSKLAPQRLNITYVEDEKRRLWAVDALAPVPASMRAVAGFGRQPESISPFAWSSSYVAPAPDAHFSLPSVRIVSDPRVGNGRRVTLQLQGSSEANQMALVLPEASSLDAVDFNDWRLVAPAQRRTHNMVIACMSRDCATARLTLTFSGSAPVEAVLGENRFGLPAFATPLVRARPDTAVPSQNGDGVLLIRRIRI